MSTPTFDIGTLVNAVITAFVNVINAIATAISENATAIGQAVALGAILYGIYYALVRTPIGRWIRRVLPF